jgi:hypothetical protein
VCLELPQTGAPPNHFVPRAPVRCAGGIERHRLKPVLSGDRDAGLVAQASACEGGRQWLRFYQAFADGEADEVAEAFEIHFVHDVIAVALDGARGDAERRGRFLIALAFGE